MNRILFFFLFLGVSAGVFSATKLEDRYVMQSRPDGQLYFILPYSINSPEKGIKPLDADVTYITNTDTLTLNVSAFYPTILTADSVVFEYDNSRYSVTDINTFFIESEKKFYHHRYSLKLPYQVYKSLWLCSAPFMIIVYTEEGITLKYCIKEKNWEEERDWMNRILKIIDSNKRMLHKVA